METLGKYTILETIGKGGFGTVYRAQDRSLDRFVALKVLHPNMAADVDFLERFRLEAKISARFRHPNLVGVYSVEEDGGRFYIAMEYMPGGSLQDHLARDGRMSFAEARRILLQVCAGLQVAHAQGLVHRDIKPGNILFSEDGQAVVSDFGLVKAASLSSGSASSMGAVGTPFYKAPELWLGRPPATPATDVYSLGCVLYEMLSGRLLFPGDTPDEVITRHLVLEPEYAEDWASPDSPPEVEALVRKALQRDPGRRYQDAAEFAQALWALKEKQPEVQEPEQPAEEPSTPTFWQNQKVMKILRTAALLGFLTLAGAALLWGIPRIKTPQPAAATQPALVAAEATSPGRLGTVIDPAPEASETPASAAVGDGQPSSQADVSAAITPIQANADKTMISPVDGMVLAFIPAGEFIMGGSLGSEDAKPGHYVTLDAFWMDATEVTHAMFAKFLTANNNRTEGGLKWYDIEDVDAKIRRVGAVFRPVSAYENRPVTEVTWYAAKAYCEWAGRRLPTEAEWEKAAQGGMSGKLYPWGSAAPTCQIGALNGAQHKECISREVFEVARFASNQFGLFDMAGNVWEWTADWYGSDYYSASPPTNPGGPEDGLYRVARGGSWDSDPFYLRVSVRSRYQPLSSYSDVGFRCAQTP